jgi:hypothetical protein
MEAVRSNAHRRDVRQSESSDEQEKEIEAVFVDNSFEGALLHGRIWEEIVVEVLSEVSKDDVHQREYLPIH